MTAAQVQHHEVWTQPHKLRDELYLIDEAFRDAGYDTYAWMNHPIANARLKYVQGVPEDQSTRDILYGDDARFAAILERLRNDPDYKAFVVTTFTVTHGPYRGALLDEFCAEHSAECADISMDDAARFRELHEQHERDLSFDLPNARVALGLSPQDVRGVIDTFPVLYRADVFRLDRMFGEVFGAIERSGMLQDSLIAFTADHGELFYRDNAYFHWTHGYQLTPEVTGVPLLLFGPNSGVPHGRYDAVSRSIDVFPTIAGLAEVTAPDFEGRGEDLSAAVRGEQRPPDLTAYSHTPLFYAPLRARRLELLSSVHPAPLPEYMWAAMRTDDLYLKLHRSPDDAWSVSAFDLASDPHEARDVFRESDPEHVAQRERLESYKKDLVEAAYPHLGRHTIPRREMMRRLRSLGYVD